MTASYDVVNYSVRPAKNVERKMLSQIVARLRVFEPLESYTYIGFGSTMFVDFQLMHRLHGFESMISIEKDVGREARFKANLPFACVALAMGESTRVLPTLDWSSPAVVWLDYDDPLAGFMLADVEIVTASAQPGTLIVVSVNADPGVADGSRAKRLAERIGWDLLGDALTDAALAPVGMAQKCLDVLNERVQRTISDRTGALPDGEKLHAQQLSRMRYRDGASMATGCWLVHLASDTDALRLAAFERLDFVTFDRPEPYEIVVPTLTPREVQHLAALVPSGKALKLAGVRTADVEAFARSYRYFPFFVDVEV